MKKLIALYPILYQSKQYAIGDELPINNNEITKKWINGSTAKWIEETEDKNTSIIDSFKENYDKKIAEIKEQHKLEIEQLKAEKDEAINKYNHLLKLQTSGKMEENSIEDEEKQEETVNNNDLIDTDTSAADSDEIKEENTDKKTTIGRKNK